MSESSQTMDAFIEKMSPADRREHDQVMGLADALEGHIKILQFITEQKIAEVEIGMAKDYQQKEYRLRRQAADLENSKASMRETFGEKSKEYELLLLEEKLVSYQ
ncbi:hypothetical protein ARMSODRAFT_962405 [Armillaria solidipes]|uniref:Uncharacterized protein n=1 Tax=Armillaria solidipes TaxID=1076256 RepID=A0A2H3B5T9_9AGAR|nr:hypothetical protein ARMSODRAFT_962405 [Armillaria solidipes]